MSASQGQRRMKLRVLTHFALLVTQLYRTGSKTRALFQSQITIPVTPCTVITITTILWCLLFNDSNHSENVVSCVFWRTPFPFGWQSVEDSLLQPTPLQVNDPSLGHY